MHAGPAAATAAASDSMQGQKEAAAGAVSALGLKEDVAARGVASGVMTSWLRVLAEQVVASSATATSSSMLLVVLLVAVIGLPAANSESIVRYRYCIGLTVYAKV